MRPARLPAARVLRVPDSGHQHHVMDTCLCVKTDALGSRDHGRAWWEPGLTQQRVCSATLALAWPPRAKIVCDFGGGTSGPLAFIPLRLSLLVCKVGIMTTIDLGPCLRPTHMSGVSSRGRGREEGASDAPPPSMGTALLEPHLWVAGLDSTHRGVRGCFRGQTPFGPT